MSFQHGAVSGISSLRWARSAVVGPAIELYGTPALLNLDTLLDGTGLNLTVDGVDCSPRDASLPHTRCVIAVISNSQCAPDFSVCGEAGFLATSHGAVYATDWNMSRWVPLVRPQTGCPPIMLGATLSLDYGVSNCTEMQLRRSMSRAVTHRGRDGAGALRTGLCVIGGYVQPSDSRFGMRGLSSVWCTFNGAHWFLQDEMPVSAHETAAASHRGKIYLFGGYQGNPQTNASQEALESGGMYRAAVLPCVSGMDSVRGCSNSNGGSGGSDGVGDAPWAVTGWELVLPLSGPLANRIFPSMFSVYGVGCGVGDPSLQGLRGPPWEQPAGSVQPRLVVAGGIAINDPETFIADMWFLNETQEPPVLQRVTPNVPAPPPPLPVDREWHVDGDATGSYFLFDYRGRYNVTGQTLPTLPDQPWAWASGGLMLIAGSETYYSADGGVSWSRMLNFEADGAPTPNLESPLWSGLYHGASAAVVGLDDEGLLQLKGLWRPADASYSPSRVFASSSAPCGACPDGQRSTGCSAPNAPAACTDCTICGTDQYLVSECAADTPYSDRVCAACSTCGAGLLLASACNATHDTVCVAGASLGEQEAWLHASAVVCTFSVAGVVVALVRVAVLLAGQSGSATASAGVAAAGASRVASRVVHETWVLRLSLSYGLFLCRLCMVACAAAVLHCDRCSSDVAVHARAVVALLSLSFVVQTLVGSHMLVRFTRFLGMEGHRESLLDLQLRHPGLSLLLHSGCLLHSSNLGAWLDPWLYVGSSKSSVKPRVRSGTVSRALSTASLVSFVVVDVPVLVSSCVFVAGVARSADWRGVVEPSGVSVFSPFVGWSLHAVRAASLILSVAHPLVCAASCGARSPSLEASLSLASSSSAATAVADPVTGAVVTIARPALRIIVPAANASAAAAAAARTTSTSASVQPTASSAPTHHPRTDSNTADTQTHTVVRSPIHAWATSHSDSMTSVSPLPPSR